jgi:cysteine dioxygenase
LEPIHSLEQLLEVLPKCSGQEYVEVAHKMEIPVSDFKPYAHWSPEQYTRNCISRTDKYELLLLCWEPGMDTPIHCHGGEECWVYALQGSIIEERFDYPGRQKEDLAMVQSSTLKEDAISYMNDNMGFHKLINNGSGRAMTLHLYMNPIDECRIYNQEKEEFELKRLEYHSFKGKILEDKEVF